MSSQDIHGLREQILENTRFLIKYPETQMNTDNMGAILVPSTEELRLIVVGEGSKLYGMVMLGYHPVLQGPEASTVEAALRRLLIASVETIRVYNPKTGGHQRNIHGGGVFDEDFIAPELKEIQKKNG